MIFSVLKRLIEFGKTKNKNKKKIPKFPCRKCVYYVACGDSMRRDPCEDRKTKEEYAETIRRLAAKT